jgi:hypothetical protein
VSVRIACEPPFGVRFGPLLFLAVVVLAVPAIWAGVADSCTEGAWAVPVLVSGGLAAAAIFTLGFRRGHPVLGVLGALVGGGLWLGVAFFVAFLLWIPFVPDRCTYDWVPYG